MYVFMAVLVRNPLYPLLSQVSWQLLEGEMDFGFHAGEKRFAFAVAKPGDRGVSMLKTSTAGALVGSAGLVSWLHILRSNAGYLM